MSKLSIVTPVEFEHRDITTLFVGSERQRTDVFTPEGKFINSDGLLESVARRGIIQPIIAKRSGEIVAGERRWNAAKLAGQTTAPVRYTDQLDPLELRVIELEENLRRRELSWRDETKAIADIHQAYAVLARERGEKWSMKQSAQELRMDDSVMSTHLRVAEDLGSERITKSTSVREAYNVLARMDTRAAAEVMEAITEGATGLLNNAMFSDGTAGAMDVPGAENNARTTAAPGTIAPPSAPSPPPEPVQCADFLTWAPTYTGQRFNLIHCDFPYGIEAFSGPQSGRDSHTTYDDSRDVYIALIEALCRNLDRLMASSAHLVFWLSADIKIMHETIGMFAKLAPDLLFWQKPLVWHKTDNVGVLAKPGIEGRHVYEAALVASREDRPLVRSVSDCYGAPTDKRWHPSAKPEPVLRHFLAMFVDEHSRMLDPTCGGGSSLRAAESLGADSVLGLELSPEHAKNASLAMRQFRALRSAAE